MHSMDSRKTARRGVDIVRSELQRRGITPRAGTSRSPNELRFQHADGDAELVVLVRSRTAGDWQTDTRYGKPRAEPRFERMFWVFVDMIPPEPVFYVVPAWWIENDIYTTHQAYLARHGGLRARTLGSTHHRITTNRVEGWRDRWDLLGLPRNAPPEASPS
jgi:hypothetical protein